MKVFKNVFTSESVTEGHPDKIADQISDAILDAILEQDKNARVACETFVTTGTIFIGGEITTTARVDYRKIAREKVRQIGYTRAKYGFDCDTCAVIIAIDEQSPDISQGVDRKNGTIGAGDQGLMFGYATNETIEYMPVTIFYAHKLAKKLADVRRSKLKYLRPDGKTQVTFEFDDNGKPIRVDTIVISTQHDEKVSQKKINSDLIKFVIGPVIPKKYIDQNTIIHINPTGKFVIGGPQGDAGLTGRKIIVDTYGGVARHGGGAFSGKDYTKVDRSAAYAARYVAKNIVAAKIADRCEIQISYAIGITEPVSIAVNTFGTSKLSNEAIIEKINKNFDLSPSGIIKMLNLKRPIYSQTAAYGHFGRSDLDLPWEKTDKIAKLTK